VADDGWVVVLLPMLRELYLRRLSAQWKARVVEETEKRVRESQSAGYNPHGREKALGPWGPGSGYWWGRGSRVYSIMGSEKGVLLTLMGKEGPDARYVDGRKWGVLIMVSTAYEDVVFSVWNSRSIVRKYSLLKGFADLLVRS
jgi:hypothetical protein